MELLFWNADTQYDHLENNRDYNGLLLVADNLNSFTMPLESELHSLTCYAADNDIKVINTANSHTWDDAEISENPDLVNTFPMHCERETFGAHIVGVSVPENPYRLDFQDSHMSPVKLKGSRNIVLYKNKLDVFDGNAYTDMIIQTYLKPEKAVVYGAVSLDSAVRGLLEGDVEVFVPTDAISALEKLPFPLNDWKDAGVKLVTTKDVLGGRL